MQLRQVVINLPSGAYQVPATVCDQNTSVILREIYTRWRYLCDITTQYQGRAINLPDVLSEMAFCLAMPGTIRINAVNIPNEHTSFDCYNVNTGARIQVKSTSVQKDLTSFGPDSIWDELYFCDFYKDGLWNGEFDIYYIPSELIYNYPVNARQTLADQQREGKRPRLSIKKGIIEPLNLQPIVTYRI